MVQFKQIITFIRELYGIKSDVIPLHNPVFNGNEKKYLNECIESTYVSSVGKYVDLFEQSIVRYTGSKYAIATVNGTAALHMALMLAGVTRDDEVITQSISFVATANAIAYCGAHPVFLDGDLRTLGLSVEALQSFLTTLCIRKEDGYTYNSKTGRKIAACVPMHVFGHPAEIDKIKELCDSHHIILVEDAAESIGSFFKEKHTGTFGDFGILSFNGNKTITTGGGGMILTNSEQIGRTAKHLTTTAKRPHPWEYFHDYIGYNYRLPNINAAIGCAQMENLPKIIENKRQIANLYKDFFNNMNITFITEPEGCISNYWLNAIMFENLQQRNDFLEYSNSNGVMTRPLWTLIPKLPMYSGCMTDGLDNARWIEDRLVNIPPAA